jgi:uncharacterized protein with GYD domain
MIRATEPAEHGEQAMPKMLMYGTYTRDGVQGLMKEGGSGRRKAVEQLVSSAGGTLEALYWAFGDNDVYLIADMPDNATAAGVSLAVGAAGAVQLKTVVLLTAEEVDEAIKKSVNYRPPGS